MALMCPDIQVTVVDQNAERIKQWNSEQLPIYEVSSMTFFHNSLARLAVHQLTMQFRDLSSVLRKFPLNHDLNITIELGRSLTAHENYIQALSSVVFLSFPVSGFFL